MLHHVLPKAQFVFEPVFSYEIRYLTEWNVNNFMCLTIYHRLNIALAAHSVGVLLNDNLDWFDTQTSYHKFGNCDPAPVACD